MSSIVIPALPEVFWTGVLTLAVLIIADLLLGVAEALKVGKFDLLLVAEFYKRMVIPSLLGWFALTILTLYASKEILPSGTADLLTGGLSGLAWAAATGQIVASILKHVRAIYGIETPIGKPGP